MTASVPLDGRPILLAAVLCTMRRLYRKAQHHRERLRPSRSVGAAEIKMDGNRFYRPFDAIELEPCPPCSSGPRSASHSSSGRLRGRAPSCRTLRRPAGSPGGGGVPRSRARSPVRPRSVRGARMAVSFPRPFDRSLRPPPVSEVETVQEFAATMAPTIFPDLPQ